jgi:hypothetical protein
VHESIAGTRDSDERSLKKHKHPVFRLAKRTKVLTVRAGLPGSDQALRPQAEEDYSEYAAFDSLKRDAPLPFNNSRACSYSHARG